MAKGKILQPTNIFDNESLSSQWLDTAIRARQSLESFKNPYIGNKRKILVDIALFIQENGLADEVKGKKVLDLFSGSAFVSFLFKSLGASVWSNDILASSCLHSISFVANDSISLTNEEIRFLIENQSNHSDFVSSRYTTTRFTEKESLFLDNYYENACNLVDNYNGIWLIKDGDTKSLPRDIQDKRIKFALAMNSILCYVMDRCQVGGRLNHGQIFADLNHRLAHQRNRGMEMKFKIQPCDLKIDGLPCVVSNLDAIDLLKGNGTGNLSINDVNLIYIDPPYGGQQSDYPFMYSFAEEYLRQTPFEKITEVSSNRKYTKSKGYEEDFLELLSLLPKSVPWIFSYNNNSWKNIEIITENIKKFKSNIIVKDIDYNYLQRKDRDVASEYLILAR